MSLSKSELVSALKVFLAADAVIFEQGGLRPYECDGLPSDRQMPLVAVLPYTASLVSTAAKGQANLPASG